MVELSRLELSDNPRMSNKRKTTTTNMMDEHDDNGDQCTTTKNGGGLLAVTAPDSANSISPISCCDEETAPSAKQNGGDGHGDVGTNEKLSVAMLGEC